MLLFLSVGKIFLKFLCISIVYIKYICIFVSAMLLKDLIYFDMISNTLHTELSKLTHNLSLGYKQRVSFETSLKAETSLVGFFNGYEFHHVSNTIFISLA